MRSYKVYKNRLRKLISTEFEINLAEAALKTLFDETNKLRLTSFSLAIRELSRHVLLRLAPDKDILKCSWFEVGTDLPPKFTRADRVKYAIQGGLNSDYLLGKSIDPEEYTKPILKAIELLNKYTHVNESTFNLPDAEVSDMADEVIKSFSKFISGIKICRDEILKELGEQINNILIDRAINEHIDDVDLLSTSHSINYLFTESVTVTDVKSDDIIITASGFIDVTHQFGSSGDYSRGDGLILGSQFPFESILTIPIQKFPKGDITQKRFEVDTDSWFN